MYVKPLVASIVILAFLLFILFGLLLITIGKQEGEQNYNITIVIRNVSSTPKSVLLEDGRTIFVNPEEKAEVTIPVGNILTVKTFHQDGIAEISRVRASSGTTDVFLGDASHGTNLTSMNGLLKNESNETVRFVEIGSDGRRWHVVTLPPWCEEKQRINDESRWQIVAPGRENISLADIRTRKGIKMLSYNGTRIDMI